MELSGHPTQDLLEELIERGAMIVEGDRAGPTPLAMARLPSGDGGWLWIPEQVFETGFDERP
jgi:hypothetical protein